MTSFSDFTIHYVLGENCDVLAAVCPGVFMVEAQSVKNLVDDVTQGAPRPNKHLLLSADEAHVWSTARMNHFNVRVTKRVTFFLYLCQTFTFIGFMENNQFWIQFKIHKVFRPSAGFEDQVVCLIVSLVEGHAGVFRHHRHRGEDVVPPTLWKIHKQWNSESQETRCSDRMSGLPISELIS